jgi:hypothetical protein
MTAGCWLIRVTLSKRRGLCCATLSLLLRDHKLLKSCEKNTLPRKIKLLELLSSPSRVEPRYQRSWLTPTVYAMRDGNFSY